jgi:peroxiredoxin
MLADPNAEFTKSMQLDIDLNEFVRIQFLIHF